MKPLLFILTNPNPYHVMEIPDGIAAFIEVVICVSAGCAGVILAINQLKKEESFVQFLIGDLDD